MSSVLFGQGKDTSRLRSGQIYDVCGFIRGKTKLCIRNLLNQITQREKYLFVGLAADGMVCDAISAGLFLRDHPGIGGGAAVSGF